jgi:photosystem II stability/assembly factor-like uncharacterized protein
VRPSALIATALVSSALAGCHVLDFSPRHSADEIDLYDDLFAVSVPDDDHAVAVGYHGAIYWTGDGGKSWGKGETPTQRLLYGVSMADSKSGWAVGQLGTILRSEDGGRTWTQQENPKRKEGAHLFDVEAIDANTAWVVGEWGTRMRTRDGGKSWEDLSITLDALSPLFVWLDPRDQEKIRRGEKVYEDVGLNNLHCLPVPSSKCWIIGEFGYIFWSDDQGETWTRSQIVSDLVLPPVDFAYNEIEIGDEARARIEDFAHAIRDQSYLKVQIEPYASEREIRTLGDGGDPTPLFDLIQARIDAANEILEGAGLLSDRINVPNKPPFDFEDFLADDSEFLNRYLAGRKRASAQLAIDVVQNPYLFTIRFQDEQRGLISGLGGLVLRSEDGGRSWRYGQIDRKQALYSVDFGGARAIAVGEKGLVRISGDGGASWSEPTAGSFPPVFTYMRDLVFEPHGRVGYIVGQQGMVLRTTDGGESFVPVLPPRAPAAGA